jgi:hypothetical protein
MLERELNSVYKRQKELLNINCPLKALFLVCGLELAGLLSTIVNMFVCKKKGVLDKNKVSHGEKWLVS